MNKKFKHKSSGKIFKEAENGYYYYNETECVPYYIIVNSYDWDEVVKIDYEILEFVSIVRKELYILIDNRYINQNSIGKVGNISLNDLIRNEKDFTILKVKRLSDDEIFTVGDKCKPKTTDNVGLITNIEFCKVGLRIESKGLYYMDISGIEHCKIPLFITEDKFEIFNEGIPIIIYSRLTKNKLYSWIYLNSLHDEFGYSNIIIFVDPINANNWIEENKPQYSKKDLMSAIAYSRGCYDWLVSDECFARWMKSPYHIKK